MFRRTPIGARRRSRSLVLQAVWVGQRFPKILDTEAIGNESKDSLCRDGPTNRPTLADDKTTLFLGPHDSSLDGPPSAE